MTTDYLKKILTERSAVPVHDAPFAIAKESDERIREGVRRLATIFA